MAVIDPRPARSRALILGAATDHFISHGYVGANVDDIAAEAGVSKRTVYNLFESKERLFREVIETATVIAERFSTTIADDPPARRPIDVELEELALAHSAAVLNPRVIRLRRLLIGEAERFPDLAAAYYLAAPGHVIGAIAERLKEYGRRGELAVPDALRAGEHFAFLVLGASLDRALFEPDGTSDQKIAAARARAGAAAFLRAYRTEH